MLVDDGAVSHLALKALACGNHFLCIHGSNYNNNNACLLMMGKYVRGKSCLSYLQSGPLDLSDCYDQDSHKFLIAHHQLLAAASWRWSLHEPPGKLSTPLWLLQ